MARLGIQRHLVARARSGVLENDAVSTPAHAGSSGAAYRQYAERMVALEILWSQTATQAQL
jgi:hypothetical protein